MKRERRSVLAGARPAGPIRPPGPPPATTPPTSPARLPAARRAGWARAGAGTRWLPAGDPRIGNTERPWWLDSKEDRHYAHVCRVNFMPSPTQWVESLGRCDGVDRLTGGRKAVRDHSMPAQVKSDGKPEPTRRPHRETRPARSRLDCLKPNPQRLIKGPAATLVRRRRASGAGHKRLVAGKTARCSDRGCEPGSRDEWAT